MWEREYEKQEPPETSDTNFWEEPNKLKVEHV